MFGITHLRDVLNAWQGTSRKIGICGAALVAIGGVAAAYRFAAHRPLKSQQSEGENGVCAGSGVDPLKDQENNKPKRPLSLLKEDFSVVFGKEQPGGWVSVKTRLELPFDGRYDFETDLPKWLSSKDLTIASEAFPSSNYILGSGRPEGAASGNAQNFAFSHGETYVDNFAAKIEIDKILGIESSGFLVAMPGPDVQDVDEEHPFFKVIINQNIGLVASVNKDARSYAKTTDWSAFQSKHNFSFLNDEKWQWDDEFYPFVLHFATEADKVLATGRNVGVHCSSGTHRTGILIAAYLVKRQIDAGMHPDPWGIVLEMRRRRKRFVIGDQDLRLLYQFAQQYLQSRESPTADLKSNPEMRLPHGLLSNDFFDVFGEKQPDEWVSAEERRKLDFEKNTFKSDAPLPSWLDFGRFQRCAEAIPSSTYDETTGLPDGAAAGGKKVYAFGKEAYVGNFGAKIKIDEILGIESSGFLIAMPGPNVWSIGDSHPFVDLIFSQKVGYLMRVGSSQEYWKQEYWKNLKEEGQFQYGEYDEWRDFGVIDDTEFAQLVKTFSEKADACLATGKNVGVHCTAGIGRTGTLIAAYLIKKQIDAGMTPDPWGIVLEMRRQRRGFVSTSGQFLLLYRFAKHYLESKRSK